MLGAIAGDIIGSVHEFIETKSTDFDLFVDASRFTDDTVRFRDRFMTSRISSVDRPSTRMRRSCSTASCARCARA